MHTDRDDSAWLLLDFGHPVAYDEILVFNPLNIPYRARTLVVDISVAGEGWHRIHTSNPDEPIFGGTDDNPLRIVRPATRRDSFAFSSSRKNTSISSP